MLQSFLLGSTFKASWFLMAALVSVIFVWIVSKRVHDKWLLLLGLLLYLLCCLTSNYYNLIRNEEILDFYHKYRSVFLIPFNSFPVAMLFVVYGKVLAERSIYIPQRFLLLLVLVSFSLLYIEYYIIWHYDLINCDDDSFLSLIPLSLFSFMLVGQSRWTLDADTKRIRKASTVMYCCHLTYAFIVNHFLERCNIESQIVHHGMLFLLTLLISVVTFRVIEFFENYPHLGVLKYAH